MGVETIKDLVGAGAPPEAILEAIGQQERYDNTEVAYLLGLTVTANVPPINTAAPYAEQVADMMTCTSGIWVDPPPTSYAYEWQSDGAPVGTGDTYTLTVDDAGHSFACVLTATNASGSTPVTSNSVVATEPAQRGGNKSKHRS